MPASNPELDAQLGWLFARQRFGMTLGLERVRSLLEALGRPQDEFTTVLVGGTNGKGSCSSTLASILHTAGRRVGLFTSPHLTHFRERFVVGGEPVSDDALLIALGLVRPHAEALTASFFEIVTALACVLFAREGVELAVIEVGIGGRFDATNVLEPHVSVITNVALDHTEILGERIEQIASEKAGIMRLGRPLLTGAEGEALGVLQQEASALGSTLWALGDGLQLEACDLGWDGVWFRLGSAFGTLSATTPLLGLHQARNVALATAAALMLGVQEGDIIAGVSRTRWPGRLEPIPFAGRRFLLDGAHNPQAAQALAVALTSLAVTPVPLIFGLSADKAADSVVRSLEPITKEVILTRARLSPRAAPPETLRAYWQVPATVAETPEEALEVALARTLPGDTIVVAGSLYLIGEVRPILLGEHTERWTRYQ